MTNFYILDSTLRELVETDIDEYNKTYPVIVKKSILDMTDLEISQLVQGKK